MISGSAQFDLQAAASPHKAPGTRRYIWFFAPIILILLGIAVYALRDDFRAYALLAHFEDPNATGPLLRWESYPVTVADAVIPTASGPVRARLYSPVGVAHPRGMLVVHGIHHLGIDEPRLMNFSRAVAGSGLAVLTPQIDALADYHVDAASIPIIGESAAWFDERLGTGPVTVTGISFGGGLSLLAACDPSFAPHFRALALMGTYDDLARVSRFLATSQEELPDGRAIPFAAQIPISTLEPGSYKVVLVAVDNANNKVDIYDGSFTLVKSFTDPAVPAGFAVFGIQDFGGLVYVSFASSSGASGGYIDIFGEDGTLLKQLANGKPLNQPWGFAIAPKNFGEFSNTLLITNNTNDGKINSFNAVTGQFVGTLKDEDGAEIHINQLWGIEFGDGTGKDGATNQLFFTAGPDNNSAGLFGVINVK